MSFRAALHLALWFLLVAALAGCASLPFQSEPPQDTPAEPKRPAQFRLEVDAPADLRALLLKHLDLARLQYAAEADSLTRSEIDRLIGAASAQALSLLQTEGHFNPVVKVQRVDDGAQPPLLRMSVQPGPRATIERLTLEVQGGLYDEVAGGDAQAEALQRALQSEWALQPGQPFTQSAWDSAKNARAGHAAQQRLSRRAMERYRGAGQCREQHRAPVRRGRQQRAVPHRLDPHRRAAALRRGGGDSRPRAN